MRVIGIDIGLTGAVAAVGGPGDAQVYDLPIVNDGDRRICGKSLIHLVRELCSVRESCLMIFEDVRPRPFGNGNKFGNTMHSQGSLMRSRGIVECVASIAGIEVKTVLPQTWKRHFSLLKTEKKASIDMARRIWPGLQAELKRVKDHNRAEALLLAHYGFQEFS